MVGALYWVAAPGRLRKETNYRCHRRTPTCRRRCCRRLPMSQSRERRCKHRRRHRCRRRMPSCRHRPSLRCPTPCCLRPQATAAAQDHRHRSTAVLPSLRRAATQREPPPPCADLSCRAPVRAAHPATRTPFPPQSPAHATCLIARAHHRLGCLHACPPRSLVRALAPTARAHGFPGLAALSSAALICPHRPRKDAVHSPRAIAASGHPVRAVLRTPCSRAWPRPCVTRPRTPSPPTLAPYAPDLHAPARLAGVPRTARLHAALAHSARLPRVPGLRT